MTLPPCELIAVELGPLEGASKAILQIMDKECKPVTDVGKEKKYVKLNPTRYQTIVNREEGLEAGGVAKLCYCSMSRDNTSALKANSVI